MNAPDLSQYEHYIDLIPMVLGTFATCLIVSDYSTVEPEKVILAIATVLFLRCITIRVTILPSPNCNNGSTHAIGGCNDCVFSGHTSLMLIAAYVVYRSYPSYKLPIIAYCVAGSLLIVMTRSHYTIDVMVAWIVVYPVICTIFRGFV